MRVTDFADGGDYHGVDFAGVDREEVHEELVVEVGDGAVTHWHMLRADRFNVALDDFREVRLKFVQVCQFQSF